MSPDFHVNSSTIDPSKFANGLNPRLDAWVIVSQCARTVLTVIQRMAPNGSSDFSRLLRPTGEQICPSLLAGLNRSNFKASAPGAKLTPPCANPVSNEA